MKNRIMKRKLNLLHHLHSLTNDSLAKEVMEIQYKFEMPGLVSECKDLLNHLGIANISTYSKPQFKGLVNKEMRKLNRKELIANSKQYSKIGYNESDIFELKAYFNQLDVSSARMRFKIAVNMVPSIQMNFKSDRKFAANLWTCSGCSTSQDTQDHVIECPGYANLRTNLDLHEDGDLVKYFRQVLMVRYDLEDL